MRSSFFLLFAACCTVSLSAVMTLQEPLPLSNICNLEFYYCPRDPGCVGYSFSVTNVTVNDHDTTKPIEAKDIIPNSAVTVTVLGTTKLQSIPIEGTYKIYDMAGHNAASGLLTDVAKLDGRGGFRFDINFAFPSSSISGDEVEFGIDIFMDKSSDEGFCVEVANRNYIADVSAKAEPKFEWYCEDEGQGHFVRKNVPITTAPIPSEECSAGGQCELDWYYCPRDPGCVTYELSVHSVEVDVADTAAIHAGDQTTVIVKGRTQIKEVPAVGTYKIYDMAGHNAAQGVLTDALTLDGSGGFTFRITLAFPAASVTGGLIEFGIDVFMDQNAHEGMCVEVANPAYIDTVKNKVSPAFEIYCYDNGDGTWVEHHHGIVPQPAVCLLTGGDAGSWLRTALSHREAIAIPTVCQHEVDAESHKCIEACADRAFKMKGMDTDGKCPPAFNTVDKVVKEEQCPDGVTQLRYCPDTRMYVTVTTRGEAQGALA